MTGYKSKREAALDEDGMYLVHHTKRKDDIASIIAARDILDAQPVPDFSYKKKRMKPSHPKIRQLLHQYQDGLTTKEISERLEKKHDTIYAALQNMPDTYIDRWLEAQQQLPPQAVWCAVVPPEDCPKPRPKKSNARLTKLRRLVK